jgi:hypothetical protein
VAARAAQGSGVPALLQTLADDEIIPDCMAGEAQRWSTVLMRWAIMCGVV